MFCGLGVSSVDSRYGVDVGGRFYFWERWRKYRYYQLERLTVGVEVSLEAVLAGVEVLLVEVGAGEPVEAEVAPDFIGEKVFGLHVSSVELVRALTIFYITRTNSKYNFSINIIVDESFSSEAIYGVYMLQNQSLSFFPDQYFRRPLGRVWIESESVR